MMKNKSEILYLDLCRPWILWSYFGNWPIIKNIFTIKYPLIADFKIYFFRFYHFILNCNLLTYNHNYIFEKISNHKSENLVMGGMRLGLENLKKKYFWLTENFHCQTFFRSLDRVSNNFPFRGRLRHGEPKVSSYASIRLRTSNSIQNFEYAKTWDFLDVLQIINRTWKISKST